MSGNGWWAAGQYLSLQPDDEQAFRLLGRRPSSISLACLRPDMNGRTALVTGAGGFIGSAICRELIALGSRVTALDLSEYGLATLVESLPHSQLHPHLVDIRDLPRVEGLLATYRPSHIYHAAAYKHVPFLENHLIDCIDNNALATWNLGLAARRANVERFILVSSDKAAAAANVLGISKRLAEMFVSGESGFASVRCANVLGSPGSVLPRFIGQIARGGPLTVTSSTARRYFVTLSEAAAAILMAGKLAESGDIFIPDAGEPVNIMDLAARLLNTLPKDERSSLDVIVTLPRPGDQEEESLVAAREEARPSTCRGLSVVCAASLPPEALPELALRLTGYIRNREEKDLRGYIQSFLASASR